ncbi:class I SAM-dependent methyltransferase [Halovenus rubra]|uniref:Class I SAM-dependent methyltransferase n=2 Tax=Halovenus rubra TaxID=869890 RepID=A0ABD5X8Q3_9EURY|nr:class I SAM-dependent methyltransferase [Halovenus rubra]
MDPSTNRRGWAKRMGKFSPAFYAEVGPNKVSNSLVTLLDQYSTEAAAILELGYGSGRHLSHLHEHGYEDLTGVDINEEALAVVADAYPLLAEAGSFHQKAIEAFVPEVADNAFDVVYSVETLQHIHPDEKWVFDELVRITDSLLVTIESEGEDTDDSVQFIDGEFPLYVRNWKDVFTDRGLTQLLSHQSTPDTIRAFEIPDSH